MAFESLTTNSLGRLCNDAIDVIFTTVKFAVCTQGMVKPPIFKGNTWECAQIKFYLVCLSDQKSSDPHA
jgi:hypothetical protein